MIRPFTVFCKLNQITFSDRQWLEKKAGSLSHTDGVCPVCHAKASLSPFVSYARYLVEWKGSLPATHEITVQRYQCSYCRHTHALLSSALVPYSSYSLSFILLVLRDHFLGRVCGWGYWKIWGHLWKHLWTVWMVPFCRGSAGNFSFLSSSIHGAHPRIRRRKC